MQNRNPKAMLLELFPKSWGVHFRFVLGINFVLQGRKERGTRGHAMKMEGSRRKKP
jgi:hypothetical protein